MSIEKAAEAILAEGQRTGRMARPTGEFPACEKADKEASLAFAHAALPHLLEEPTEREISEVYDATHTCPTPVGMSMSQVTYALRKFVSIRRNAPPEPPEPSHVVELCDVYGHNTSYYGIASVRLDGVTVYSAI
jgi:hypothetical protein